MKETVEHNNRFYGEELKTENEQLKEWLIVANKEIERLNNIIKEQGLEDKPNYYVKGLEGSLKEYQEEIERLNNKLELIGKIVEREFPPNEFITYKIKKILKGVDKE